MQSECALHKGRLTGGLFYAPNTMGQYAMYAPSCNGCEFGRDERAMYGRIAHITMSVYNAQQDPTPELIEVAWDAIKVCLKGKDEEKLQIVYSASLLEKLETSHQQVVDLIKERNFDEALKVLMQTF
jgi:hypothetical protein